MLRLKLPLALLISALVSLNLFAANPIPGLIPLEYLNRPATDLMWQGKKLTPEEAHELYLKHRGDFDLSNLDPDGTSEIWKNELPKPLDLGLDELPIEYHDRVEYMSPVLSRTGNFRFNVSKKNQFGVPEIFTFLVSKKVHNVLLRKSLLRKLGYVVPPIKYLKKIQINFKTMAEKETFLKKLSEATFGAPERWVTRNEANETSITVQDLVAMEDMDRIYNMALGFVPGDVIQGRRIFRSLLVPFSLTDVPESVNLYGWTSGRIISNNLLLPYENARQFDCAYDDAKWMARRIFRLTRQDWQEIVAEAKFPPSVSALIVEKIISRRNSLGKLLKIDVNEFEFNPQISSGEHLVNGKLTKEFWEGYGSRFAFGDPENPLSGSEISSFIKMEAISTAMLAATSAINSLSQTAIDGALASTALTENLIDGTNGSTQLGGFIVPTVSGRINFSRKVVAGTYLGTNNRIQLVDTVGVSVSGGAWGGLTMPAVAAGVGIAPTASVSASLTRNYAHVKPITSIKKSLKYPFRNMAIPLLMRKYGKYFDDLVDTDLDSLEPEEKQKRIRDALKIFSENMEVGESLIVTDTIGAGLNLNLTLSYYQVLAATVGINPNDLIVFRLHIMRKDENTIHIYRDFGNLHQIGFHFGLRAGIPILRASANFATGTAKSKFYKLNINENNPDIVNVLTALRHAMKWSSTEKIKKVEKPYELKYKLAEGRQSLGLLWFRWDRMNSSTSIKIKHPQGDKKDVYRKYKGKTFGTDPVGYATDVLASLPALFLKSGYVPPIVNRGNPGNAYFGKAENRVATFEGEVTEDGIDRPFAKYSRIWNGFSASKKKAKKILKEVKKRYKFRFYPDTVLNETEKLFLYNINVNFVVYDTGIDNIMRMSKSDIKKIFSDNQNKKRWLFKGTSRFLRAKKKYLKAKKKKRNASMANAMTRMLSLMEKKLSIDGISKLVGGDANFYVHSKIEGFRVGDENGDRPYISDGIGEFGQEEMSGPLNKLRRHIGITEGEFYVNWLMGRVL